MFLRRLYLLEEVTGACTTVQQLFVDSDIIEYIFWKFMNKVFYIHIWLHFVTICGEREVQLVSGEETASLVESEHSKPAEPGPIC